MGAIKPAGIAKRDNIQWKNMTIFPNNDCIFGR